MAAVRATVPNLRHPVWTPHVTLARRVPRRLVPDALAVLADHPLGTLTADRSRWWDPDLALVESLTG